ncbi:hypothetical protein [Rathayibacter oskolensis]|uniref:hypothetical protein n=1 Tax=Rathayibacter oskolensis TaxID=1891671 RepID=UPI0034673CD0
MGFLDRLLGREERPDDARRASGYGSPTEPRPAYGTPPGRSARSEDEIAIERYRYLLKTAPPEAIEQVHREAFEQLTPEQRQQVFRELSEERPSATPRAATTRRPSRSRPPGASCGSPASWSAASRAGAAAWASEACSPPRCSARSRAS